jgi:uncharacterized protein YkwD
MRHRHIAVCALWSCLALACSDASEPASDATRAGASGSGGDPRGGTSDAAAAGAAGRDAAENGGSAGSGGSSGLDAQADEHTTAMDSGRDAERDAAVPGDAARDAARDAATSDAATGDALARTLVYPPAFRSGDLTAGLAQLNLYRRASGAGESALDPASTVGCEGHVNYLVAEEAATHMASLSHDEPNHQNPYYSVANEQAGKQSDIAYGTGPNGGQTFGEAVDLWINGLYHRTPLLDPGLVKIGAASKNGYNCLNYGATGNTVITKVATGTIWPVDGMTDVPRTFGGNEGPCPTAADPLTAQDCEASGFIPSVTFYNWGTNRKSSIEAVASATLTEQASNAVVPLFIYYADGQAGHDPAPGYVRDEIALVPRAALAANKTYRVDIAATVKGAATQLSWQFTTGTRMQ